MSPGYAKDEIRVVLHSATDAVSRGVGGRNAPGAGGG